MSGLLITAGTTTTNPNPNTLGVVNPYDLNETIIPPQGGGAPIRITPGRFNPSAAWIAQLATKSDALIATGDYDKGITIQGALMFKPSSPTATYTIGTWVFDSTSNVWYLACLLESTKQQLPTEDGFYATYPPPTSTTIPSTTYYRDALQHPAIMPIYIEIKALSAGTLQIWYDSGIFDRLGQAEPI